MSGMKMMNWQRRTMCLDDFENRGHRKTLSVTDIYRNKFEGKNSIDDFSPLSSNP